MDEVMKTYIPDGGGFGGSAWGAGLGGLVGSWIGNGGFGGFGGARAGGLGVGYDTGAINAIQEQLGNVQTQIANADRDLLMQTANSNQFVGNLVNQTGDAIVGAVTGAARDTQAGIFQNTLTQTQNQGATNLAMSQGFSGLGNAVRDVGFANQLSVVEQNGANRLQAQELASQQKDCCCKILTAIEREGCANRELQREVQTQALRDKLSETQSALAASVAQSNFQNMITNLANQFAVSQASQTQAIINALKPATTTA